MRVLLVVKRQYMRKDLLDDCYGRMFELPFHLASAGHSVLGVCLSYRRRTEGEIFPDTRHANLAWYSINMAPFIVNGVWKFIQEIMPVIREFEPDVVIGGLDSLHVILSSHIAKHLKIPYIVDLYDNFESYGLTRLPFLHASFVRATAQADAVTCISQPLTHVVAKNYRASGEIACLENAVDLEQFQPKNQLTARKQFDLPLDAKIIGTFGALDKTRNIDVLLKAFTELHRSDSNTYLLFAGKFQGKLPVHEHIIFLGELSYTSIPTFLSALDVAVICLQDTLFCRYCFPQKFYEILACQIPVVAADIGVVSQLLLNYPDLLFESRNVAELSNKIIKQLQCKIIPDIPVLTWKQQSQRLENILIETIGRRCMERSAGTECV